MRISTSVQAPPHITNPIPAATSWHEAVLSVMTPIMRDLLAKVRAANPKIAGSFGIRVIDEGISVGYGLLSTWPKWWVLEYTMPAHTISARRKPYLVFEGRDGHLVRVKSVEHPGHTGNNAIHDAVGVAETQLRAALPGVVKVLWGGETRGIV